MKKLKSRWGITSNFQLVVIFIVFALNGSLSAKISSFFLEELKITKDNTNVVLYYIILLVLVFTPFAKRMIRSMKMGFLIPNKKS